MSLQEELSGVFGKKRRYLLMRIADLEPAQARAVCNLPEATYSNWLQDRTDSFASIHRRVKELSKEYRLEAVKLLRRDNQLSAVILEEKIIEKMKNEIITGRYSLIKTKLAVEVYSKLIADLDYQPQSLSLTWEQKLQQLFSPQPMPQSVLTGGEHAIIETISSQSSQLTESPVIQESKQGFSQDKEEIEEGTVVLDPEEGVLV